MNYIYCLHILDSISFLRYTDPDIQSTLLKSSALDPRFKTLPYLSSEKRQTVFYDIENKAVFFDVDKASI